MFSRWPIAQENHEDQCEIDINPAGINIEQEDSWLHTSLWYPKAYANNLWFIIRVIIPLMMLAGLLGALLVSVLPWETITANIEYVKRWKKLLFIRLTAMFGLFLPVPIASGVAISAALYAAGLPASCVMVLLFTLGIFSVYSFSIIGNAISWRVSATIAVVLVGMGAADGFTASYVGKYVQARNLKLFYEAFSEDNGTEITMIERNTPYRSSDDKLINDLKTTALAFQDLPSLSTPQLQVQHRPYNDRQGGNELTFGRTDSVQMGIDGYLPRPSMHHGLLPFI